MKQIIYQHKLTSQWVRITIVPSGWSANVEYLFTFVDDPNNADTIPPSANREFEAIRKQCYAWECKIETMRIVTLGERITPKEAKP